MSKHIQPHDELRDLKSKADLLASVHSKLTDNYNRAQVWISSVLLMISTLLVGMTFISESFVQSTTGLDPDAWKWIIGITSMFNFAGILLLSQWRFQDKAASHREAVRFYFRIVNRIRALLDSDEIISREQVEEIRTEYGRTNTLPKIPDASFLQLKQWHLQKIAVSRELDKKPFESIASIRKRLGKNVQE